MDEAPRIDDASRMAILQYVNRPKIDESAKVEESKKSDTVKQEEYTGLENSRDLLEKVLKNRSNMEEKDSKKMDEARSKVIKLQRMDLIENLGF